MSIFLKGCPLKCEWCHNPEGQNANAELCKSPNGCIECGACLVDGGLTERSISACPRGLIRRVGEEYTVERLTELIQRNARILNASGGGVTFSGGEPLSQSDFLLECLRRLRGVTDRAIQTSGYCDGDIFWRVLCECDRVLYDLKLIDDEAHKRYTGVSNKKILNNYVALAKSAKPFVTRIPLIPSVNDTEHNIRETAEFMRSYGVGYVELLPYNKMAGGKYAMLGREYRVSFDETLTPDPHVDIFEKYGIEVRIL